MKLFMLLMHRRHHQRQQGQQGQQQRPRDQDSMHRRCGSTLLEGLLAVVLFSMGLLAILRLLTASMIESGNAQFRSEASLLASDLISQMWTGDRSFTGINKRFGNTTSKDYQQWLTTVRERLPGVTATTHAPSVKIAPDRTVVVSVYWQVPGEKDAHELKVQAQITD